MAASDYAYIAFDTSGQSTENSGVFEKLKIEPYKICLLLYPIDSNNIIARIHEGNMSIHDVDIQVKDIALSNQDGVPYYTVKLFYCSAGWGETAQHFGGVICYAYLDYISKIVKDAGIPENWEYSEMSSNIHPLDEKNNDRDWYRFIECYPPEYPEKGAPQEAWDKYLAQKKIIMLDDMLEYKGKLGLDSYCGVTNDMIEAFLNWNVPDPKWLEKVRASDKTYQNFGNVFFKNAGLLDSAVQTVEETPGPVLLHALFSNKDNKAE